MKYRLIYLLFPLFLVCCTAPENGEENDNGSEVEIPAGGLKITDISIPENIVGKPGDAVTFTAKGILEGDIILIDGADGSFGTPVAISDETEFSFTIPDGLQTGDYDIHLKRGEETVKLASVHIAIITGDEIPDLEGKNVKGIVRCGDEPLEGVVVSDGIEVTVTNKYGMYWLYSEKRQGDCVFISVPSGYKVPVEGVVPQFFKTLVGSESYPEQQDFELEEEPGQDNHRILVLGDMHLANRTNNDVEQFQDFIADISQVVAGTDVPVYGLTLGDMTWDTFWYANHFAFHEYLEQIEKVPGLPIYHTIGNHDHEFGYAGNYPAGDYATSMEYRKYLGPTYYSFNIGQIHYVVLDDIECMNDGTGEDTEYNVRLTSEQIAWLKQDLAHVDKSSTLVLATHSQIHSKTGGQVLKNYDDLMIAIDDFKDVHIFTGHTHLVYNWEVDGFYDNILEHNAGAICATWWWSGKHSGIHVCQDGAPGGYTIVDVNGSGLKWQYKGIGKDTDFQFRTYDGNEVHITEDDCRGQASAKQGFIDNYVDNPYDWSQKRSDNAVFINVWNWDPDWKVEVTENGRKLNVEKVSLRDPLHLVAYTGKSMAGTSKTDAFATSVNEHFFRVYASAPNTTLEIKVTDRFGNIYTETMERPKTFSIENYK